MLVLRLIRRVGLGAGAFQLVLFLPSPWNGIGLASAAGILAFFIPAVMPLEKEREHVS